MAKEDEGMTEAERLVGMDEENDYAPANPHARHPLDDGDRSGWSDGLRIKRDGVGNVIGLGTIPEVERSQRLKALDRPKGGRYC